MRTPHSRYRNTFVPSNVPSKRPIVLIDGDGWELTLRELVFSILILGVLFTIGFLVSGEIEEHVNARNLKYNQAVALNSNDEFRHAIDTDVGYVFMRGKLVADSPVTNEHLKGEWLSVSVEHQKYQMHTRRVPYTVTDSKGRSHTRWRTETYWSWDTVGRSSDHSPTVTYCGVQFNYGKFNYDCMPSKTSTHSTGWHKRDVVTVVPKTFDATVFGEAKSNDLVGQSILLVSMSIEGYREDLTTSHAVMIFWILWSVFSVIALFGFYAIENSWLED